MIGYMGGWVPASDVTTHTGEPIPSDYHFFASPPLEIGKVIRAETDGRTGNTPFFSGKQILYALVAAIILGAVAYRTTYDSNSTERSVKRGNLPVAIVFALIGAGVGLAAASKRRVCTFVGTEGVARYRYYSDSEKRQRGDVFLFSDADILRTQQTHNYYNGIYTGTTYAFRWTDTSGREFYKVKGSYHGKNKGPRPGDPFYFAASTEQAWADYKRPLAKEAWRKEGFVRFPISGSDYIDLGPTYMDLCFRGKCDRCDLQDIGSFNIQQGQVTLRRRDAKSGFLGFGSTGIYSFPYQNLANARLFLMLLGELVTEEEPVPA